MPLAPSGAPNPKVFTLLALSGAPAPDILHAPGPEWGSQSRCHRTPGSEWGFRSRRPHTPGPEWGSLSRHPQCPRPTQLVLSGASAPDVLTLLALPEWAPRSRRPFPFQTPTPDVRPKTRGRDLAGATPAARIACIGASVLDVLTFLALGGEACTLSC